MEVLGFFASLCTTSPKNADLDAWLEEKALGRRSASERVRVILPIKVGIFIKKVILVPEYGFQLYLLFYVHF